MSKSVAIVKKQGVIFTVLLVRNGVIRSSAREEVRDNAPLNFPRPIILAEQRAGGRMEYHGKKDIVNFLSNVSPTNLPWRNYTV